MKITLPLLLMLLIGGCGIKPAPLARLDNINIPSSWSQSGTITLQNGSYSEAAAPGSATHRTIQTSAYMAQGQIDDQDVLAAILITNQPNGSGPFYDLYLFKARGDQLVYLAQVPLGDRIQINRLTITDNMVQVSLASDSTALGLSEDPDLPLIKSFIFTGQHLREPCLPEAVSKATVPPPPSFAGKTFFWQSSLYGNDTQEGPNEAAAYSITFNKDWTLTIHSDCNETGGFFGIKGTQLTIRPNLPARTCSSQSLSPVFLRDLGDAVHFLFQDQNLYLDLIYDSGTMILRNQP